MLIIEFIIWLVWAIFMMGVSEYLIHKYLMHKRFFRSDRLNWIWFNHAVIHHKMEDNSENIDLSIWHHLIIGSPLLLLLGWLAPIGFLAVLLIFFYHSYMWTHAHRAIHRLEDNWLTDYDFYYTIAEHHENHHLKTNKNFGVIFLWTDKLFGTKYEI